MPIGVDKEAGKTFSCHGRMRNKHTHHLHTRSGHLSAHLHDRRVTARGRRPPARARRSPYARYGYQTTRCSPDAARTMPPPRRAFFPPPARVPAAAAARVLRFGNRLARYAEEEHPAGIGIDFVPRIIGDGGARGEEEDGTDRPPGRGAPVSVVPGGGAFAFCAAHRISIARNASRFRSIVELSAVSAGDVAAALLRPNIARWRRREWERWWERRGRRRRDDARRTRPTSPNATIGARSKMGVDARTRARRTFGLTRGVVGARASFVFVVFASRFFFDGALVATGIPARARGRAGLIWNANGRERTLSVGPTPRRRDQTRPRLETKSPPPRPGAQCSRRRATASRVETPGPRASCPRRRRRRRRRRA